MDSESARQGTDGKPIQYSKSPMVISSFEEHAEVE